MQHNGQSRTATSLKLQPGGGGGGGACEDLVVMRHLKQQRLATLY